jgi:hypothetical protein
MPRGPTDDPNSVSKGHTDTPMRVIGDSTSPPLTYGQNDEPCGTADQKHCRIQEKPNEKNAAEARLEPWSIIFCSTPHLVHKRREKSDGLFILKNQNASGNQMHSLSRSEVTYRKC